MWSNSNKNQGGSNVHTTIDQGGGSAKAGTFPTANRDSYWVAIFHGGVDPKNKVMRCCNAKKWTTPTDLSIGYKRPSTMSMNYVIR